MTAPVPMGAWEQFLNNLVLGLWALGGAVIRGKREWIDPETGRFSFWRMTTCLVTAVVLGQIANSLCTLAHVPQEVIAGLAATIGYIGAPATIGFIADMLTKRFGK